MIVIETELNKIPNNCKECPYIKSTKEYDGTIMSCRITEEFLQDDIIGINYGSINYHRGTYCPLKELQEQ